MSLDPEVRRGGNLPFGMIANRWMCDPRYSTNARTLYAILVSYADTQGRDTGRGKPYRVELARQLGVSVSTLDRTLDEMEVAGLVTVEKRTATDRPGLHDANLYHLHDAGVMWQGNGSWTDPLPADAVAAQVAKARTDERRLAKREAGVLRKGGVPKGVNPRAARSKQPDSGAHRAAGKQSRAPLGGSSTGAATPNGTRQQDGESDSRAGGGSTDAATRGSTDAATVAAPVLPYIENPVQNPSPEPGAPLARSAPDARRASHLGEARRRAGGTAATDNTMREPQLTPEVAHVITSLPDDLRSALEEVAGSAAPLTLVRAIDGQLAERTAAELAGRVARRWYTHGYADKFAAGALERPVGVAIAMTRAGKCGNARCEDGVDLDSDAVCRACAERRADKRAGRDHPAAEPPRIPAPRPAPDACPGCGFPATQGKACEACQQWTKAGTPAPPDAPSTDPDEQRTVTEPDLRADTVVQEPATNGARKTRTPCRACGSSPGRAAWSGLCGPCSAGRPAEDPIDTP